MAGSSPSVARYIASTRNTASIRKAYRNMSRRGRAFNTVDGDIKHCVELVPIIPRGWIIRCDGNINYHGLVFTEQEALAKIKDIEGHLKARHSPQHQTSMLEIYTKVVLPYQPGCGEVDAASIPAEDDPQPAPFSEVFNDKVEHSHLPVHISDKVTPICYGPFGQIPRINTGTAAVDKTSASSKANAPKNRRSVLKQPKEDR